MGAFLTHDRFRIRSKKIRPLRRNGANSLFINLQQKPLAVSVIPLTQADKRLSAEGMKGMRYSYKVRACDRKACILS